MAVLLLLLLLLPPAFTSNYSDEYRLVSTLLSSYRPSLRPVLHFRHTILVNVSVLALNLVRFDESVGTATFNVFVRKRWRDALLQWNPGDYGGLDVLHLPMKSLWKPDIVVISSADPKYEFAHEPLLVLDHRGGVRWSVHAHVTVYCRLNYAGFPYETHTCDLVLEPWSYDTRQVDLVLKPGGWKRVSMNANAEWQIVGMKGVRTTTYMEAGVAYARIYYRFALKRSRPLLYFYLVSPAVALGFLLPFLLLLRPSRPERLHLSFLILLALFLLLLVQWETTPKHVVGVSWPLKFLVVLWATTCVVIIWSILAVGLWERPASPPPAKWLRTVFLKRLAPLLLLPIRLKPRAASTRRDNQAGEVLQQRASFVRIEDEVESQLDALDADSVTNILPNSDSVSETPTTMTTVSTYRSCAGEEQGRDMETRGPTDEVGWRLRGANGRVMTSQWQLIVLCTDRLLFVVTAVVCAISASACYARL